MSTAGNSYEAWKESLTEAEGDEVWSGEGGESVWTAFSTGLNSIVDMKGVWTGMALSVGLLIAGVAILLPNAKHLVQGRRTVGVVVGHKDYYNWRSNSLVAPVVRYSAPGGVCDFVGCLSVARSIYPINKEVQVLYLPGDPRNAVIVDFIQMFMIPTIVGGLGLFCLTVTTVIMFFVARSELTPNTA